MYTRLASSITSGLIRLSQKLYCNNVEDSKRYGTFMIVTFNLLAYTFVTAKTRAKSRGVHNACS